MTDKITGKHLERAAYVYIRQSTLHQVRNNLESGRLQYALKDRALELGFKSVVVIDEDLGVSGTGSRERPGFGRLLAAVCNGQAGAVFALEASRLARNSHQSSGSCPITSSCCECSKTQHTPGLLRTGERAAGPKWLMVARGKAVHIFSGIVHCECGQIMYVPSNSPKYICRGCRSKITITDLDEIFCEEIKGYSVSPEAIANYLKSSNETASEKERLLSVQREELQRVRKEIQRTYDLYQQEKLTAEGFSTFYAPLEERRKQIEAALPRLEAELDMVQVSSLSAEETPHKRAICTNAGRQCNPRKSVKSSKSSPTKSSSERTKSP